MHEILLGKHCEDFLQVMTTERLVARERELERRALDVIDENVQVVWIDQRALRRRIEEVRGMADDELIKRSARRDHDGCGCFRAAPCAPGASQASNRALRAGHSASSIEYQALSRFFPLMIMCWRKMPS